MLNCCDCCENTLNIGCVGPCGLTIDLGVLVPKDFGGEWVVELNFQRRKLTISKFYVEFSPIILELFGLNENYTFSFKLRMPNGEYYAFFKDAVEYDCISFTTQIGANSNINVGLN